MKSSRSAAAVALVALAVAGAMHTTYAAGDARRGADYFTNLALTTHEGRTVRFYDDLIKGKIVAIDLIYTTCQYACPLETARLAQVQRLIGDRMGRDVFFYSITIDPDHDTPAVLKEYAEKFQAGPGWKFLTGSKADIDLISRKVGLYTPPDPGNAKRVTKHEHHAAPGGSKRENGFRLRSQNHRRVARRDEEPPGHRREGDAAEEPDDGPWLPQFAADAIDDGAEGHRGCQPEQQCQAPRDDPNRHEPARRLSRAGQHGREHAVFR